MRTALGACTFPVCLAAYADVGTQGGVGRWGPWEPHPQTLSCSLRLGHSTHTQQLTHARHAVPPIPVRHHVCCFAIAIAERKDKRLHARVACINKTQASTQRETCAQGNRCPGRTQSACLSSWWTCRHTFIFSVHSGSLDVPESMRMVVQGLFTPIRPNKFHNSNVAFPGPNEAGTYPVQLGATEWVLTV